MKGKTSRRRWGTVLAPVIPIRRARSARRRATLQPPTDQPLPALPTPTSRPMLEPMLGPVNGHAVGEVTGEMADEVTGEQVTGEVTVVYLQASGAGPDAITAVLQPLPLPVEAYVGIAGPDLAREDEALVAAALGSQITADQVRRAMHRLYLAQRERDFRIVTAFLDLWQIRGADPTEEDILLLSGLIGLDAADVRRSLLGFRNRLDTRHDTRLDSGSRTGHGT